jgi:translation initiation factor 4A
MSATTQFVVETSNPEEFPIVKKFDDMELPDELLRGIYAYGFEVPSAIQSAAIMPLVKGRDVLGQAQSGTGKTGTFGTGLLSKVDPSINRVQGLVMAHTHELASQICDVIRGLSSYMKINVVLAVGGIPRHHNAREMRTAHVVIGTPGRIWDLASSGDLKFSDLRMFVLDEADEMLRDRFADQVNEIVNIGLPSSCQVAFFSATMPPEVKELADKILHDPVRITLRTADVKLEGIKQYVVALEDDAWKLPTFLDIYESLTIPQSIIFVNTKERAEWVHGELAGRGFPVSVIYGEPMPQAERQKRMQEFRNGATRVLISTNLLARGIDVQQVELVFNFDIPSFMDKESYIHRIGRCGRFGRKGVSISLLNPTEQEVMKEIASHYSFQPLALPQDLKGVL